MAEPLPKYREDRAVKLLSRIVTGTVSDRLSFDYESFKETEGQLLAIARPNLDEAVDLVFRTADLNPVETAVFLARTGLASGKTSGFIGIGQEYFPQFVNKSNKAQYVFKDAERKISRPIVTRDVKTYLQL